MLLWLGTVGMSDGRLDAVIRDYLRHLGVDERVLPDGADALAKHFSVGEEVVAVTACAERLAVPLCRAINPGSTWSVPPSSGVWAVWSRTAPVMGARKVEMLAEFGVVGAPGAGTLVERSATPRT